jgi:hypothetical protein
MTYYKYKDGKVIYMETGATKLPKQWIKLPLNVSLVKWEILQLI